MKLLTCCFAFAIILTCCKKEDKINTIKDFENDSLLVITYGSVCGWCAGLDSLTIISNQLQYVSKIPCTSPTNIENKTITDQEKEELLNTLNPNDFSNIQLFTCHTCADGCDYWISIKNESYDHEIRYGIQDIDSLSSIKKFIDKLDSLKAKFNSARSVD